MAKLRNADIAVRGPALAEPGACTISRPQFPQPTKSEGITATPSGVT